MTTLTTAVIIILGSLLVLVVSILLIGIRIIPNNKIGIVEKWWSPKGSLDEEIIALNGEAGYQPKVLRGGIHLLTPLMYKVHVCSLVTIRQGEIGYVFARDGEPLPGTQTLGRVVEEAHNFQNVEGFIQNKGQKGIQRAILREGTYAFNLAQFVIITSSMIHSLTIGAQEQSIIQSMSELITQRNGFKPIVIKGVDDQLGIVTVHDGPSLSQEHIVAPTVGDDRADTPNYHNNFQDVEKFLVAGGYRGRQYQVLTEGTYFINCMFATVELIQKTFVPVGSVGVVISYTGEHGKDDSGEDYKHGELVAKGYRGVWKEPLTPGKYAFNTYAGKIVEVPTTNIILKWISNEGGDHLFDTNLKEVSLITKDAFEPSLPLSVVLHIDYKKAPYVIQRFGDIKMLVDQTLDPMVSAYFKNIGQSKTLIQLLQERSDIQEVSSTEMKTKFAHYNIELEEVLIGTPSSSTKDNKIEIILGQLRDRQVAMEQIETYNQQEKAAVKERELNEAMSKAAQQKALTESEINIKVQDNDGRAAYQRSLHDAEKIKALADADAEKIKTMSRAEAEKIKAIGVADAEREAKVGISKAIAINEQVKAYGGPKYQVLQDVVGKFTSAIEKGEIEIVPKTYVNMGGGDNQQSLNPLESLLTILLTKQFDEGELADISLNDEMEAFKKTLIIGKEGDASKKESSMSELST